MSDLRQQLEGLREDWHGEVSGAELDDLATAHIANRARRSRTTRTALTWASGAAAVTVVAVAVWAGMGAPADVAPPAQSASVTPSERTTEATTEPTSAAQLPTMPPVTDEVWADVSDGWTLVTLSGANTADNSTPVYLVDPSGQAYALPSAEPDMTILQWVPGEREAWFSQCCDASVVRVDLSTGTALPTPEWLAETDIQPMSILSDGRVMGVDSGGSDTYIVGPEATVAIRDIEGRFSPDGAYLASSSGVLDTHTGEPTGLTGYDEDGRCYPMGWYDATTVAIACGIREDATGLVFSDGSVRLGDVHTGEIREAPWPQQPGISGEDAWATTGYVAMPDGAVLVGVATDPGAGEGKPNKHESPTLPSRSQPHLLTPNGVLHPLAVPGLEPECALLIPPRTEGGLIPIRDLCTEGEPRLAGLFRLEGGELVPGFPLADVIGDVSSAGISGWAG